MILASIGPRLFSRGKGGQIGGRVKGYGASIGPRLFSRGKTRWGMSGLYAPSCFNWAAAFQPRKVSSSNVKTISQAMLQLGRGFSAAESSLTQILQRISGVLQLGRGFSAAERIIRYSSTRTSSMLQLGRGFSAAESCSMGACTRSGVLASIGPRLFSRGKSRPYRRF